MDDETMNYKDYYEILGVSADASHATIKQAYRDLARKYHPDLNGGDQEAERRFKDINEAYTVLSDADRRTAYDRLGQDWESHSSQSSSFNWSGWFGEGDEPQTNDSRRRYRTRRTSERGAEGPSPRDGDARRGTQRGRSANSGEQHSTFSDFFQQFFSGGSEREQHSGYTVRTGPFQRSDQSLPIEISLEEAFWGTTRTIQQGNERFEVTIPRGVKSGSKVRVNRDQGDFGGSQLTLLVTVRAHDHLIREGDDLQVRVDIDLYTALLGGEIEVPTIEGHLMLVVPPNTQNGRTFRLKGQGMPHLTSPEKRGDLYADLRVHLPVPLSEEEKRRFMDLRRLRWDNDDFFS